MGINTEEIVFNLMQKVADKLEEIEKNLKSKDNEDLKEVIQDVKTIKNNQLLQNKKNKDFEVRVVQSIEDNLSIPTVNNYKEYSFLGGNSTFKKKELIILLFGVVFLWSSIKYIPSFFTSYSTIVKEKEDYEFFYNYILLKQFESSKHITANKFLERIQQKDTVLIDEYHKLLDAYQYERRKQQLKEELRKLEKNDR